MLAILVVNGGIFLMSVPMGTNGRSINSYIGANYTADTNWLNAPVAQASSMTAKENQTVLQQFASSFYIFGDIIGGISFFISLFANLTIGISLLVYSLVPAPANLYTASIVMAITALVYISGFIEMLAGRKVE